MYLLYELRPQFEEMKQKRRRRESSSKTRYRFKCKMVLINLRNPLNYSKDWLLLSKANEKSRNQTNKTSRHISNNFPMLTKNSIERKTWFVIRTNIRVSHRLLTYVFYLHTSQTCSIVNTLTMTTTAIHSGETEMEIDTGTKYVWCYRVMKWVA